MFSRFTKKAIQSTFRNYTRNTTKPSFTQYTFAVTSVSALSLSVYCNQPNPTALASNSHTNTHKLTLQKSTKSPKSMLNLPEKYSSWTEFEIMSQPQAISKALQHGTVFNFKNGSENIELQPLSSNKDSLQQIKDLIITTGDISMNTALYAKKLMEYIQSFESVQIIDDSAMTHKSNSLSDNTGILAVGNDNKIVNSLDINPKNIISTQKSETFTSNITEISLIAAWFSQMHGNNDKNSKILIDALHKLHTYAGGVIRQNKEKCIEISNGISKNSNKISILGRGFGECIAYEGCAKFLEITGMNANVCGDANGVICIVLDDEYSQEMIEKAKVCVRQGKSVVYITDKIDLLKEMNVSEDRVFEIPSNGPLTALLAVVLLQMMAYYIAMAKGREL